MTVAIESAYTVFDPNEGAGFSPGVPIVATPLQNMAKNHNFMRARFTPPIFYALNAAGLSHSAGTSTNLIAGFIPGHADSQGLTVEIVAKISSGGGYAYVNLGGTSQTMAISGSSYAKYTTTFTSTSTGTSSIKVGTTHPTISIASVIAYWVPYSGTIADTIQSSGFRWCQNSEFANTEPLTVEQANRFLEMPRLVLSKVPQNLFSLYGNLTEARGFSPTDQGQTADTFAYLHRSKLSIRFKSLLSFVMCSVGPSGSQVRLTLRDQNFQETELTLNASATSLPANPSGTFTPTTGTLDNIDPGLYDFTVEIKSGTAGTAHSLYSLAVNQYQVTT